MANDRLINSTQGDSIISELRTMNTNLADIKSAMSGGSNPIAAEKDVNFYDYDGTCRYSYTAAEFADLTAMPDYPTHEGLTAQGWNWSLSDAKTYVASYGKLNVGQMYITSDGKTRLYIRLSEGRLKPYLGLTGNSSSTAVSIDWGDNSTAESVTLNSSTVYTPHEYTAAGEYVIVITVTTGSISFNSTSNSSNILRKSATANTNNDKVYQNTLIKLEVGDSVTSISGGAFAYCSSLASITIPAGITSIGNGSFILCSSLASITIPAGITSISDDTFNFVPSLASVTIPNSVTSIGANAFYNCSSLASVTIPTGVTSIGANAFQGCYGLGFIKFSNSTPPTASLGAFSGIPTDCIIYVPTGSLSAYTSASNYPSSSTYTYVEY